MSTQNLKNGAAIVAESHGMSAEAVDAYLRDHPEFLVEHPDLLNYLTPPSRWRAGSVVDMQHFMLERLRGELNELRDSTQDVIETSRSNMSIQTRTHAAVLALLGATSLDDMLSVVADELPLLLDLDSASLCFEPAPTSVSAPLTARTLPLSPGMVDDVIGDGCDVILVPDLNDDGVLFGEAAGLVRSAAIARLNPGGGAPAGLLAMGTRSRDAFHPAQGTELIAFVARVLEICIQSWLIRSIARPTKKTG